jgi:hypothetical protein
MPIENIRIRCSTFSKVKKSAFASIEKIVFRNKGIIYGGAVRDGIISEEYTKRYLAQNDSMDNFWDKHHSPETIQRLLQPDDMDVCMYTEEQATRFIEDLQKVSEFSNTIVVDNTFNRYYSPKILCVKTVTIRLAIAPIPFISEGKTLLINIDVVIPKRNISLEPPFNNLDMLCNAFIKVKEGRMAPEIRLSKNTGTIIDYYSVYQRTQVTAGICKDMIDFKTYLTFSSNHQIGKTSDFNLVCMRRISKMFKKEFKWTFLNMPFTVSKADNDVKNTNCCICCSQIEKEETVCCTSCNVKGKEINSPNMHYECLMSYLDHQRINTNKNEIPYGDSFAFKCPIRNTIDFRKCLFDVAKVYV